MSDELKTELRYYLRVVVTIAVAIISLKLGIKIDPPPLMFQSPIEVHGKVQMVSPPEK